MQKFGHVRFEPAGFTNNPQIPIAKSITDYIFRYLSLKFLGPACPSVEDPVNPTQAVAAEADRSGPAADETQIGLFDEPTGRVDPPVGPDRGGVHAGQDARPPAASSTFQNQDDAPACPNCGGITVRAGACYSCPNCGASTGCG